MPREASLTELRESLTKRKESLQAKRDTLPLLDSEIKSILITSQEKSAELTQKRKAVKAHQETPDLG